MCWRMMCLNESTQLVKRLMSVQQTSACKGPDGNRRCQYGS